MRVIYSKISLCLNKKSTRELIELSPLNIPVCLLMPNNPTTVGRGGGGAAHCIASHSNIAQFDNF